jgi:hypothetical protein
VVMERPKKCFTIDIANSHILGNRQEYPNNGTMSNIELSEWDNTSASARCLQQREEHQKHWPAFFFWNFFVTVLRTYSRRCVRGLVWKQFLQQTDTSRQKIYFI